MSYRTIMIFPEFDNMQIIDDIRNKYDPLAKLVRPHITLVFPFESDMSNEDVASILDTRLTNTSPFEVELKGFSKHSDPSGNYLFLDIIDGIENIIQIHDELYKYEFKNFDLWGADYIPHITVGKLSTENEMNEAYECIKGIDDSFSTIVSKISVEMIGENEESIIIIEKKLLEKQP